MNSRSTVDVSDMVISHTDCFGQPEIDMPTGFRKLDSDILSLDR